MHCSIINGLFALAKFAAKLFLRGVRSVTATVSGLACPHLPWLPWAAHHKIGSIGIATPKVVRSTVLTLALHSFGGIFLIRLLLKDTIARGATLRCICIGEVCHKTPLFRLTVSYVI